MSEAEFLIKLPDHVLEKTIGFKSQIGGFAPEKTFLKSRLPTTDLKELEHKIKRKYHFSSVRANFVKRTRRKGCPRNPGISSTQRRALGLNKIDKKGLKFKDLLPLHDHWTQYMRNLLNLDKLEEIRWDCSRASSQLYEDFTLLVWKADYHGAYLEVSRSTCPSYLGLRGICVFETKNTLSLLGEDDVTRCIQKNSCEFSMKVGNYNVKLNGKHFLMKPTERSVKKLKGGKFMDL